MTKQAYVINAGKLIDGKTDKVFHNYSVLVEGSLIREVGPTDQITGKIGKDVVQYNYTSNTIVPGLIDCHVHLTMPGDGTPLEEAMDIPDEVITMRAAYNAKQALKAGTTTLREMGAKKQIDLYPTGKYPEKPCCWPTSAPERASDHLYRWPHVDDGFAG
jgi:imidazolonepropionase-like amidohydrolase